MGIERTNGSLSFRYLGKSDNTTFFQPCTIEQDLGELDSTSNFELVNKILIGSGPWQLNK